MLPKNTCTYPRTPHFKYNDTVRLGAEGWRETYGANTYPKKAGVAVLFSDKAEFRARKLRDKEGHYIMTKGSTLREDTKSLHV